MVLLHGNASQLLIMVARKFIKEMNLNNVYNFV